MNDLSKTAQAAADKIRKLLDEMKQVPDLKTLARELNTFDVRLNAIFVPTEHIRKPDLFWKRVLGAMHPEHQAHFESLVDIELVTTAREEWRKLDLWSRGMGNPDPFVTSSVLKLCAAVAELAPQFQLSLVAA